MTSPMQALPRSGRLPAPFKQVSGPQWLLLLVVLFGMAIVGDRIARRVFDDGQQAEAPFQTGTVATRTIESSVSATGTVSATRQVRITFPTAGQVQDVLVKQGDRVQEGQLLATLNTFNLETKRDQARTNLATTQYRLEALLTGPTSSDVAAAQQTVATAQSTLTRAQNDLFTLLAGASVDEIAAARASVDRAQANLALAQSNWEKLASGTDLTLRPEYATLQTARANQQQALTNYVNRTAPPNAFDVSTAQATLNSAQASLDSARAKLNQVLAGADPLDIANARNLVVSAEAALTAARAKLQDVQNPTQPTGPTSVEIAALEAQVESARRAVDSARAKLTDAAFDGTGTARVSAEAAVAQAQAQLATAHGNLAKATAAATTTPTASELATAQQGVTTAETNLRNAQNNLSKLLQGPSAADIAGAQQPVSAAETQVQSARNTLDKLLAGATPDEIAAAKAALDNAASALETAQTNWDRLSRGVDLETRPEYTALIAARSDYQTATSNYNIKTQGPKQGDVDAAQAAVDAANASVNGALARLAQVQGGSLPTDIGVAREAVNNAELALRQTQFDLDNAAVKSPIGGTVVSVGINPRDQVGASTVAFNVLDPELIRVDATVDEANVIRLRQAMPVTVTFDALQGRSFQGVIATVTPAGATQQGVVTFPVTVVFNAQGFTIPPGTTANLRVVVESKPNVLAVPSRAIVRQGRETFVQVPANGTPELKAVRTGISGDNFTEILGGLEAGETIIVSTPQQRAGQQGTFGSGGLPGLGTGAPAPAAPAQQPARR